MLIKVIRLQYWKGYTYKYKYEISENRLQII